MAVRGPLIGDIDETDERCAGSHVESVLVSKGSKVGENLGDDTKEREEYLFILRTGTAQ